MNSRCLYCDKRLSLFHGKKKPFCSDAHEDLYLERQAVSGLDRLKDDFFGTGAPGPTRTPAALSSPKPPEQFAYPELEPGFFDDDPPLDNRGPAGIFNRPSQPSADGVPPPADYLISSVGAVQAAPPSLPFREPVEAAFDALAWTRPVLLEGAPWFLVPAQIAPPPEPLPPPLATSLERLPMLTLANLPVHLDISKISALRNEPLASSMPRLESQPQVIEPEAPPLIKSLVSPPVTPLRVACPDAPRTFRDSPLDMAFPAPAYQPHCHALKFVSALPAPPPCDVSPQSGQIEYLPAPQPVRFRMLLDLRGAAFQTSTHLLLPARLVPLTWNAALPEALDWPLAMQRRRPGQILPKLEPVLRPQERYL